MCLKSCQIYEVILESLNASYLQMNSRCEWFVASEPPGPSRSPPHHQPPPEITHTKRGGTLQMLHDSNDCFNSIQAEKNC